jgi:hypothetical protein
VHRTRPDRICGDYSTRRKHHRQSKQKKPRTSQLTIHSQHDQRKRKRKRKKKKKEEREPKKTHRKINRLVSVRTSKLSQPLLGKQPLRHGQQPPLDHDSQIQIRTCAPLAGDELSREQSEQDDDGEKLDQAPTPNLALGRGVRFGARRVRVSARDGGLTRLLAFEPGGV